ncbi:MAG: hypothetical protein B1H04_01775 [Planctomycetales bacterium 4484_123]|nr:MAG: hypothetical protein B1H04_01775 [Planctomycetales bacterium 4484_123]
MPTFEYTAKDASGQTRTGTMQADSEAAVVHSLDQRELYPVRIATVRPTPKGFSFARRVRLRHLSAAYGQLADLLAAGVPMLRALDILAHTSVNATLARTFAAVREEVSAGATLADALAKYPEVFSQLHVAMVRAGEHAGFLEEVLTNLAGFLERQDELRSKVTGAMIYPALLVTIALVVVNVLLVVIVPKFQGFLGDVSLPWVSRAVFAASGMVRHHPLLLVGTVALAAVLVWSWVRSEAGRRLWGRLKLRIPLAGHAMRMVAITRFCRVLGTMLANGVNILQALEISKDATGNAVMAESIQEAVENVRAGEPLAEPLRRSGLFPAEIIEMIAVAEESNQLEKVLVQTADTVERRTNRQVDAAVRLVEPLLLMVMAALVGSIAVGIMYPILTLVRTLQ